ncbi:MAG: hypothetical protein JF595_14610 [Sphingomonadales bacterium]|nr:hypothetical protein [Sphingomonadales bacterium]
MVRLLVLCALPLALAGCKADKKPDEARTAQGEILEGSASDAMLPLDTVRSQPPLAPEATSSGKAGPGNRASAEPSEAASAAAEPSAAAAPAPAATTAAAPAQ